MLTEHDVMDRLRAAIQETGSQRLFAIKHGFTPGYINDVLHGKRALADRILEALGIERIVAYRLKDDQPSTAQDSSQAQHTTPVTTPPDTAP